MQNTKPKTQKKKKRNKQTENCKQNIKTYLNLSKKYREIRCKRNISKKYINNHNKNKQQQYNNKYKYIIQFFDLERNK